MCAAAHGRLSNRRSKKGSKKESVGGPGPLHSVRVAWTRMACRLGLLN